MKKLIFMLAVCASIMSCTGNKTVNNNNVDSTNVDTTSIDTISVEDTICDSLLFQE